jgi:hypothetical protein
MRKSKQETAVTRERIVKAAASEFRQHGIVATGLADLMSAAGLTHGGFCDILIQRINSSPNQRRCIGRYDRRICGDRFARARAKRA